MNLKYEQLVRFQSLPINQKIALSERRIDEWYRYWNSQVYVSFSGGKDSTVLLDIVRKLFPDVPAVFVDTGLEYPEIREFVKTIDNVIWIRPKMNFKQVIEKFGYPVISKEVSGKINEIRTTKSEKLRNKRLHGDDKGNGKLPNKWKYLIDAPFKISANCCNVLKKNPCKAYEKETGRKPIIGTMANDSKLRKTNYLRYGCNVFKGKMNSKPLSFWLNDDIWQYIKEQKLSYSEIYNKGVNNTGCMFCMFGIQFEDQKEKFNVIKKHHPKIYDYCMNKLNINSVLKELDL